MNDTTLREQFVHALARYDCEMNGLDYDTIGDMERGVARAAALPIADRLVHIVLIRLQGALVDGASGVANTIDDELAKFATVVDINLATSDREIIARVIVDAILTGTGILRKEVGGPLDRIEPTFVQILDRRL